MYYQTIIWLLLLKLGSIIYTYYNQVVRNFNEYYYNDQNYSPSNIYFNTYNNYCEKCPKGNYCKGGIAGIEDINHGYIEGTEGPEGTEGFTNFKNFAYAF